MCAATPPAPLHVGTLSVGSNDPARRARQAVRRTGGALHGFALICSGPVAFHIVGAVVTGRFVGANYSG